MHGSVDWFWELPALSGAAFAFLGAAAALEPGRGVLARQTARRHAVIDRLRRFVPAVAALAIGATALWVMGTGYLGERALDRGRALAAIHPGAALHELSLAAGYEPLDSAPLALGAAIELRGGHPASALLWTRAGLHRDSADWVLWLEDGLAAGALRQVGAEKAAFDRARTLDPSEPVVALAISRAGTSSPLTIEQAAAMLAVAHAERVKP